MSESIHSPGPFTESATPSSDFHHCRYINDAEGNAIATVRSPAGMSQDEALANADLLKASFDLLEALENIVCHERIENKHRLEQAHAAIRKARGEK